MAMPGLQTIDLKKVRNSNILFQSFQDFHDTQAKLLSAIFDSNAYHTIGKILDSGINICGFSALRNFSLITLVSII